MTYAVENKENKINGDTSTDEGKVCIDKASVLKEDIVENVGKEVFNLLDKQENLCEVLEAEVQD